MWHESCIVLFDGTDHYGPHRRTRHQAMRRCARGKWALIWRSWTSMPADELLAANMKETT